MPKTAVSQWDQVPGNNLDIGGISLDGSVMTPSQVDNAFRELMAQVFTQLGKMGVKGADIASATTTDLSGATGWYLDVTDTTTITGFGTVAAGQTFWIRFTGILTLTHNATSLILPGAANITTAAGDVAQMMSLGSGSWRCVSYTGGGASLQGGTLRLTSGSDASPSSTLHAFQIGSTSGPNLIMDTNELMTRDNGSLSALVINEAMTVGATGNVAITGTLTVG